MLNTTDATRRRFLASLLAGVAAARAGLSARTGQPASADLPRLDPKDKMAVAFAYVADAKKVDAAKFPTFKPTQTCATCSQLTGKDGAPWRPCKIFPGKSVSAAGWCKVWVRRA